MNVQTVRFYERKGILPAPSRTPSGCRSHRADAVRVIRFVKRAQALGFTLGEVRAMLSAREQPAVPAHLLVQLNTLFVAVLAVAA